MGAYVDLSAFLVRDGSRQLTANWNLGNYAITVPSIYGSASASGNLSLRSTSDATKGKINLGATGNSYFNEVDETLVINSTVSAATPTSGSHLTTKDYVDAISQGLEYQESVLDRYDPTGGLPGSPITGDRYISTATANGWTIHYIYEYNGATWDEFVPNEGWACWVEDEDILYMFNGSAWVKFGSTVTHGNLLALDQDDHSGHPWLLGRSGGQTLSGGTDASDSLRLQSTTNATKGNVYFGAGSTSYFDEVTSNFYIGGVLTITGNLIKASGGVDAIALTGANVEVKGEFTARGDFTITDTGSWTMNVDANGSAEIYLDKNGATDKAGIRLFLNGSDEWWFGTGYSATSSDFNIRWGGGSPISVFNITSVGVVSIPSNNLVLGVCANAGTDTDKFLVLDVSGNVDFRTGAEVLSDIGGVSASHTHDGQTLEFDGVNSNGGAFSFSTTGEVSFNNTVNVSGNYSVYIGQGLTDEEEYGVLKIRGRKSGDISRELSISIYSGTDNTVALSGVGHFRFWGELIANPDDNSTVHELGNVKLGSLGSDEAYFAHYDKLTASNYALKQDSAGTTFLNGQSECYLKIAGATYIGLSSSKVNIQQLLETDNVTMGKSTAESWSASVTWLQLGGNGTLNCTTSEQAGAILKIMENAYTATSNEYYISSDYATKYRQNSGEHVFRVGPSGTAGNPITWTTVCEFKTDTSANFPTWITTPKIEVPDALTTAFQIIKGSEAFFKVNTLASPEILYVGGTNTQLILQCPDNDPSALDIKFGATSIIKLDSTNNAEILRFGAIQNLTEIIEMPESYSDGIHRLVGKKVTTTDATQTTCASVTLSDDSVYHFTVDIIAEETTSNDEQASYKICGTFYRDGGGGATLVGSVTQLHVAESTGTMDVTMDANSNDARVRVTGIASTSIRWIAYITYQKLTLT